MDQDADHADDTRGDQEKKVIIWNSHLIKKKKAVKQKEYIR